jgi:predicted DCC family thiol-disulfide oxidoreductase YuxK
VTSSRLAERAADAWKGNHLILYDGVCCLCNRLIQFVLRRDKAQVFRFASLQSDLGQSLMRRHGKAPGKLDTVVVIANYDSTSATLLCKASAAFFILKAQGGVWRLAAVLRVLPDRLLNWFYDLIARNRYRIFGRYESCPTPSAEQRSRFFE